MKDTITTIILVVATFCLVAVCIFFIIEVIEDTIKERKAWKRRAELIKNWSKLDLITGVNQDNKYPTSYYHGSHDTWERMCASCLYNDCGYCNYTTDNIACTYHKCYLIRKISKR